MYEETPIQPVYEPAPKKTNTGLIIGIAATAVLCCCCVLGAGFLALTVMGPAVNNVFSTINEDLLTPAAPDSEDFPALPTDEYGLPQIPESPYGYDNFIPQGGLGDEILRADTWVNVLTAAALSGCAASDPSKTTIEVIQQPNSEGMWKEKWTVTCDGGAKKSFDVTFTPSAQGGTNIDVTSSK